MSNEPRFSRIVVVGIIFSISIILLIGINAQIATKGNSPPAKRGVLDLSSWDFASQGPVDLDGEWEFYSGQLLAPADFNGSRSDAFYTAVPGTWRGMLGESGISRKGYGTYRLKVLVGDTNSVFGLKVQNIRMSHKLFVNGKLEQANGVPSEHLASFEPKNTPYTAFFPVSANEMEIIIQAANYNFFTGGIVNSLLLGSYKDMLQQNNIRIGTDIGIILLLCTFGTYHLSLYVLRRSDRVYLLSGGYTLLLSLSYSLFNEKLFQRLLPGIPFDVAYKLLELVQFLSGIVFFLFFASVEVRLVPKRRLHLLLSPLYLYIAAVIALPYRFHAEVKYVFAFYLFVVMGYILLRLAYLYAKSEKGTYERQELALFIGACLSLTTYFGISNLHGENLVSSELLGRFGVVTYIVFMQILLAVRFTEAYSQSEVLSQKLTVSNQLKDEFLLNTSHELKTPLHGIMSMASYVMEDEEDPLTSKQKRNLSLIKDTSMKLSMLVQDLIDVSRLKHGELRLYPTIVDVRIAVAMVFDLLRFELGGKTVLLDNQVASHIWVLADENRLRQVLYNLVHNAIKHTEYGMIKVMAKPSAGQMTTIFVEDTGGGIAQDRHALIFESFEQLYDPYPNDGYTGMGIGLYISRKLVERMGGEIRVDWSEVGEGTRMMFTLPKAEWIPGYKETASASEVWPKEEAVDVSFDITDRQAHTILIVDDEASNIHVLHQLLRRRQYNVIAAFSAEEALGKMKKHPKVDLVILDVMMPGISGIELCETLRTRYSILDLPILFATVKDSPQDIVLGFKAGANDYVSKPFNGDTLIARIQTLLAMKSSIQEAVRNELAFHQAQIKPHFLYNALSSVISFCYTDGEKAAYLLSMLSQYLRYILDMDHSKLYVPLHRELDLIQAYVEIEKVRFGERFRFICHVDEALHAFEIPSLCIQPFVENAIRHGLFEKEGQGTVTLFIREGEEHIQITIEDDGVGIPDDLLYQLTVGEGKRSGIGISNIKKRLAAVPGAALSIHSDPGLGTKVVLYFPTVR